MKPKLKAMKEEIKRLGALIKEKRPKYKGAQRSSDWNTQWSLSSEIGKAKYTVRHMGIAFALARGRKRSQIESTVINPPDEKQILAYMKEYECEDMYEVFPEQTLKRISQEGAGPQEPVQRLCASSE